MNTLIPKNNLLCLAIPLRALSFVRKTVALLPLWALALSSTTANADIYYFTTAGVDTNSGTNPSAPKQSLQAAAATTCPTSPRWSSNTIQ